jgi:putative ABC transport system permease protein
MKTQLTLGYTKDWKFIIFIFIIFGMVGIISGLYPAFYLSSFEPVSIIKGKASKGGRESKGIFRRILVAFQFVISISLILSTLFINKQVNYIKNKDLGFDKTNLLRCHVDKNNSKSNFTELRNVLLSNPSIVNASVSSYLPFHSGSSREINWEGALEGKKIAVDYNAVDYNFINTFKMKIIKGRNFSKEFLSDKNACLINETFAAIVGWNNPIGKKLWDNKYNVIGVIKDFHPYSVHNKIPPCLMTLNTGNLSNENEYCVKILPNNIPGSIEFVNNTLKRFFPDKLFEVQLFDNDFDRNTMAVWNGVQNTFGFFSVLAIIIAVIGLLGLVSFTIQRRTKEIGIRKVLGASRGGLYLIIIKEFLIILFIAIIFAAPGAYIFIKTTPGAYKPIYTAGDFILPLIGIITFTALITLQQVLGAVTRNPVKSLKYE